MATARPVRTQEVGHACNFVAQPRSKPTVAARQAPAAGDCFGESGHRRFCTGGDSAGQIPNMDATGSTVTDLVYIRATINNNGTVTAGTKTTPNIRLSFTENQ